MPAAQQNRPSTSEPPRQQAAHIVELGTRSLTPGYTSTRAKDPTADTASLCTSPSAPSTVSRMRRAIEAGRQQSLRASLPDASPNNPLYEPDEMLELERTACVVCARLGIRQRPRLHDRQLAGVGVLAKADRLS